LASAPACTSNAAMSRSPCCTAQCSAVLPSGAGAFTLLDLSSNARTRLRSAWRTASTSAGVVAARAAGATAQPRRARMTTRLERVCPVMTRFTLEIRKPTGAVRDCGEVHIHLVEQRETQVHEWRVQRIPQMTTAFEPPTAAACQHDRQIDGRVVVAVPHSRAVEEDGVIKQCPVSVGRPCHLFHEACEERHMVRVDLGLLLDVVRVV